MKKETPTAPTADAALTEAELKRQKRNEYARAYYAAHKDKMKAAVRKCQLAKKAAAAGAKPEAKKTAKKAAAPKAPSKGKALHAIAPKGKAKPTAEQKTLAKLQKKLAKAQEKLGKAKDEVTVLKTQIAGMKALVKATKQA